MRNPYHQLSAIKDIVSYSLVFYCWVYIFETVCKIIDGKIYLLTYDLKQIYNANEFGLFYRAQPNKSLNLKNENCVGGKHSKLHLAGLKAANAVREKLPLFVIDKSNKPRCFKHIKHLPCRYRSQKKSWMDNILFHEWVREADGHFTKEGRKIVLLVDNCPTHPFIANLVSNEFIFLPSNTTSKLQSMDQGAIRPLKAHYMAMSVKKLIEAIEKKNHFQNSLYLMLCKCLTLLGERLQTKLLLTVWKSWNLKRKSIWSLARCWQSL